MKKIKYLVALLVMVVLFCVTNNTKVEATYQEENAEMQENKTESAKWFDKEMQDKLWTLAFSASGACLGVGMVIKSFKRGLQVLNLTNKKAEDNSKSIEDAKVEMKKDNKETQNIIKENNESTLKAMQEDNAKTREQVEVLKEVLLLAFSNDEKLVKKGVAEQIVNKLGSDSNGKTN